MSLLPWLNKGSSVPILQWPAVCLAESVGVPSLGVIGRRFLRNHMEPRPLGVAKSQSARLSVGKYDTESS
ncbi:unnamed protein product [Protopolystoma xenopodis]|uniref:Uncharacterized protein n=1 Tax=Protopolystoma xenopodis TaxID=117903 RepID=A0A3S5ACN0_9PLAT|nr:unnamed protein product [Protopolystoma xenopodis]